MYTSKVGEDITLFLQDVVKILKQPASHIKFYHELLI